MGGSMKRFWSYIKNLRKEAAGVAPLKVNGQLISDTPGKADALNKQFQSVFTNEPAGDIPDKGPSPHPTLSDITVTTSGISKLLHNLNPHKAAGPDQIRPNVLKQLKDQIAPVLSIIFQKSLDSGSLPDDWKHAYVAPIFKKGEKYKTSNYRPVSLTCICCKLLEHIVVSHVMKHFETNNILYSLQHGFRTLRSCETQLLMLFDDLARTSDKRTQTDVLIMDFAKAFDKVPHRRLSYKLNWYGVRGSTLNWIDSFLANRTQAVVLDGELSSTAPVTSGVPQGTVLGPALFLAYINDLPDHVSNSAVRLFADDCIMYRPIRSINDTTKLQQDLDGLSAWEEKWLMEFHPGKCYKLKVSHAKKTFNVDYTLHGQTLEEVDKCTYLGVKLSADLKWKYHISSMCAKANSTLGLLRRNLKTRCTEIKDRAYRSLVRPKLEFACTVWDYMGNYGGRVKGAGSRSLIDGVQRRAARYVCSDWDYTHSVTSMCTTNKHKDMICTYDMIQRHVVSF
jgi:hypothetical protein